MAQKILQTTFAFALLIALWNFARAADCEAAQTQAKMTQCAGHDFQKVDKVLNNTYSEYQNRLNESQKRQLQTAQLAWIKFRDQSCDFESSGVKGGSAYPMVRYHCLAEKTKIRIKELEKLASCKEGDLSCPAWK
jgi:uncharacterized protein YecT (DUF1311 family)